MGLVEVIVALVILAIGVLGFIALQIRALEASNEALNRIQAMNIARDLAERIRANQVGLMKDIVVKDESGNDTDERISAYENTFKSQSYLSTYTWSSCYGVQSKCTSANLAIQDANQILYKAHLSGMKVGLSPCRSTTTLRREKMCIYVAWGTTEPLDGVANTNCTNNGNYHQTSKCIVLEAF